LEEVPYGNAERAAGSGCTYRRGRETHRDIGIRDRKNEAAKKTYPNIGKMQNLADELKNMAENFVKHTKHLLSLKSHQKVLFLFHLLFNIILLNMKVNKIQ
jgi:hypothetical protein